MKRTIAKFTLSGLIVVATFFVLVPLANAHTLTTRPQVPFTSRSQESCDHVLPPPLSSCHNDRTLNTKTIYDFYNEAIGELNLFDDQSGCYSIWAGLKDTNNPRGCFTIESLQIIETNGDKSAQGAVDSIPHDMCSPGQWESTKMNGWAFDQVYYDYAHSYVTDSNGTDAVTNTATASCYHALRPPWGCFA